MQKDIVLLRLNNTLVSHDCFSFTNSVVAVASVVNILDILVSDVPYLLCDPRIR